MARATTARLRADGSRRRNQAEPISNATGATPRLTSVEMLTPTFCTPAKYSAW